MEKKSNEYCVENIVLTGAYILDNGARLDKADLSTKIQNSHVAKKSFPALICKDRPEEIQQPRGKKSKEKKKKNGATMLLFDSAKFVVTGVRDVKSGIRFITSIREQLQRSGVAVRDVDHRVVNIIGTGMLDGSIDLDKIITTLESSQYEPEVFPGLIYKVLGATFLLYKNGKFVFTGVREEGKITGILNDMRETIRSHNLFLESVA
jgi:transcription initiation factor TFIID TATA-box-binding protein